jgi:hypothetical protein
MGNQVCRYFSKKDYLDPNVRGVPVGPKFKSWEDAVELRNELSDSDPKAYYNIVHTSHVMVINLNDYKPKGESNE